MFEVKDIFYCLYYVVKQLITYFIISWNYNNKPNEDICSDITKVKASHWIENPDACNEFVDKYLNSLTTTIFSAYGLLLLFAFLVLVPMDIYAGSKSIIKRIVYKQLGIDDDDKLPASTNGRGPMNEQARVNRNANLKANNAKKALNEKLADNLINFLRKLNDLSNLKELYILLKGLRKDTHYLLPKDDDRKIEIKLDVKFETLEIE